MPMVPFYTRCREIAEREFPVMKIKSDPQVPSGTYGLVEWYCDEPGCDCRRVFLEVRDENMRTLATINFGWESIGFYRKWMGSSSRSRDLLDLRGPSLAPGAKQSAHAPRFLELVRDMCEEAAFVDSVRAHYRQFRQAVASESRIDVQARRRAAAVPGPNAPCPCESGKKYKKCCGRS